MILASAPLRVSFFGGGSDIKSFYAEHGGAFLSAAIASRVYLAINSTNNNEIKIHYSQTEIVKHRSEIEHPLIREALGIFNIENNIEIGSFADIPTDGTGLGSSSTFSVALLGGLRVLTNTPFSARDLAEAACFLEIEKCKEPIGKQDQYASAFGGLNIYEIDKAGEVQVNKNIITRQQEIALEESLYLVYTGRKRKTASLLKQQNINMQSVKTARSSQQRLVEFVHEAGEMLIRGDHDAFGLLLNDAWAHKKKVSSLIANRELNAIYDEGLAAGALGGKLLGAGGGGFFLFYVPTQKQEQFKRVFNKRFSKIKISQEGFMCHYEYK